MANQRSYFSLIFFFCFIQCDSSKLEFQKWNPKCWMEVGRNHSGLEWWLTGSRSPRLYAWQPNHGNRGPTYTREPKPGSKFSRRSPKFGDPDSFPSGFNQTVARKVARKLGSAFHSAFTTKLPTSSDAANLVKKEDPKSGSASLIPTKFPKSSLPNYMRSLNRSLTQKAFRIAPKAKPKKLSLPIIPHMIPRPYPPFQDAGNPLLTKVNATSLTNESIRRYTKQRALRERRQTTPDAITELDITQDQLRDLKARVNRRFLIGYDCSKPVDVKPVSSFIHHPCEPVEQGSGTFSAERALSTTHL